MRKNVLLLLFVSIATIVNANKTFAPPTTPSSNISFNILEGGSFRINWTAGNGSRRIVVMRQGSPVTGTPVDGVDYNANATFGNGDVLNAGEFVVFDNTNAFVDVSNLQPNTVYHIAIFEYNGTGAATEYLIAGAPTGSQSTLSAPTTPASNITFTNVSGSSVTLNWVNGDGTRRLVLMRAGGPVNANPSDLTAYNPSTVFGSGTQIGTGNFVVFRNTGTTANITNLQPNTTYHVAVFELNGFSTPVYLTAGAPTGNFVTPARPTVAASNLTFNIIEGTSMRLNWTAGNGARRIVVARAGSPVDAVPVDGTDYAENANFTLGEEISPGQRVVYDGTGTFVDISGLTNTTTYHYRIYEYSGTGANIGYLTSSFASGSQATLSAPTVQASALNFTNIGPNSVTLNWTNGDGTRRLVLVKQGSPVDFDPLDGTLYSVSTSFGSSPQYGTGNYGVYNNTGSSVTITNLTPGFTYHFAILEFNGFSGPVFLRPPVTAMVTTGTRPTIPSSNLNILLIDGGSMRLTWTNGNGARRIVVARAGSAVDAVPADATNYVANSNFNLGEEITPGQRVVYDGTGSFVDINGLTESTTYHYRIYEYSGTGATVQYLTASFPSSSQATLSPPVTPATNVVFSNVSSNTMTVSWTNGNGNGRLVLMKQGSAVDAPPVSTILYNASASFGSGAQIGTGNFVVYRSTGSSVNISNLTPGATYHVAVFEYNGNSTPAYNIISPPVGSQATSGTPTVPASNLTFLSVEGNSMRVNWTSGNGSRRIVVARAGSPVDAVPVDGTDYAENANFTLGEEISPGQRVVYDNTGTFVDLTGLTPGTTYHFRVYEYSGSGATIQYLTASFGSGSQATVAAPALQPSNITFTGVTGNAMTINWTNGNGAGRLVLVKEGSPVDGAPQNFSLYSVSNIFGLGAQIGTGNYVVYRSTGSNVTITGLTSGTTYYVAIFEYNGNSVPVYNQVLPATANSTTIGAPQVPATTATAGSITGTSMQLNWTNGSGQRRLVLMKAATAVDANPVDDVSYTANSFFGSGSQIGTGNFVVFDGTGNTVTVTSLTPGTQYHFAVFEFNSFGATILYLTTSPAIGNATTNAALPVTFLQFKAENNNNNILLQWSTAQEQNSSHFEIQKSSDGRNFTSAGIVQAAGESSVRKDYSWTDPYPFAGSTFYRLRQVDKDNSFAYSNIISIQYEPVSLVKRIINPVQNTLFIELTAFPAAGSRSEWTLYDIHGRRVKQGLITGNVTYASVGSLTTGYYVLEVKVGNKTERRKLVKE